MLRGRMLTGGVGAWYKRRAPARHPDCRPRRRGCAYPDEGEVTVQQRSGGHPTS